MVGIHPGGPQVAWSKLINRDRPFAWNANEKKTILKDVNSEPTELRF